MSNDKWVLDCDTNTSVLFLLLGMYACLFKCKTVCRIYNGVPASRWDNVPMIWIVFCCLPSVCQSDMFWRRENNRCDLVSLMLAWKLVESPPKLFQVKSCKTLFWKWIDFNEFIYLIFNPQWQNFTTQMTSVPKLFIFHHFD